MSLCLPFPIAPILYPSPLQQSYSWIFRSSRKSLDYTKQSLRISIDLGKREEESETWLQVGRIYYLIQEDELADMYLQVRGIFFDNHRLTF